VSKATGTVKLTTHHHLLPKLKIKGLAGVHRDISTFMTKSPKAVSQRLHNHAENVKIRRNL